VNPGYELRSGPWVAAAYLLAPLASLILLSGFLAIPAIALNPSTAVVEIGPMGALLVSGEIGGLILELLLVTPILMAIRFLHWRWITRWVAALMGLAIGEAVALLMGGQGLGGDNQTLIRAGLICGTVGAVAAVTFHLIAMRRVRALSPAEVF
jgi:hypothetical protein